MQTFDIRDLLASQEPKTEVRVQGWVRTRRDAKDFLFLEVNDGSCLANIQVVVDESFEAWPLPREINTGASVIVDGDLVASQGKGQAWEIKARDLELVGTADEDFPLQKKRHTDEFLRQIAHLRVRSNKYGAMFRIRSEASHAVHKFFRDHGFHHVHTPILTGSDCEGAGELFHVGATGEDGKPDMTEFFGKPCRLTVSGQLEAELMALALGKVYTFGPTFRAENSNTPRHVAEFWMVEPEIAFADLAHIIELAERFIKFCIFHVMDHCEKDLELFAAHVDKGLMATLENVVEASFAAISYWDALEILQRSGKAFEFPVTYGADLQTEHERFLAEEYFKKPVTVFNYPASIKPFYMRVNDEVEENGERTVAGMDVLVPRIGELIGGSQREERLMMLAERMAAQGMNEDDYWWYLDTRRHGTVPHAGFGMGFERLLMLLTGAANIRDVIPFPRTPKHLEF